MTSYIMQKKKIQILYDSLHDLVLPNYPPLFLASASYIKPYSSGLQTLSQTL